LRGQSPDAQIDALVTRYNEAVLSGNSDIDSLFSYTKAKHRRTGESAFGIYMQRLKTIHKLRGQKYDWILLPGGAQQSSLRFAQWIGSSRTLVRGDEDCVAGGHEVEQTCHLLTRMGLEYQTPAPRVAPAVAELAAIGDQLMRLRLPSAPGPLIGLHVSARKPSQRWPAERFATLARRLHERYAAAFLLLWAPGRHDDPQHPGDDEKAATIMTNIGDLPVIAVPTARLEELIAAISVCDQFICGDGGAMHLAAGLGKPIIALFGQSAPARWRPWGVPNIVLQEPSLNVCDIAVEDVLAAYRKIHPATESSS
jgi:heptosyltransferase-3